MDKFCEDCIHNEVCQYYAIPPHKDRCNDKDTLDDLIPRGGWIPISERLPDKNMPCLVSVGKFNFTQIAMYSDLMETIDHKIFYQGDYGKNNFQNITEYVKAWQPLPEPYQEGGAE